MAISLKKTIAGAAIAAVSTFAVFTGVSYAAGGESSHKMEHVHWHFNGMTGTYDRAAMQRGYQVYREVCSSCHSLKHLSFRHLGDKGAPFYDAAYPNPNDNPDVKAFAADWLVADIDSETGDPLERPGIPADKFPPIYANSAAAAASNGGAIPPDLSVIVKARGGGADYIYNLLVSYGLELPHGTEMSPGTHYNPVMEGGAIAMAAPLSDGLIDYDPVPVTDKDGNVTMVPGPEATVEQMAKDVTEFLAWSADPKMENRKSAGLATMIYLLILTVLVFLSYKRVWRNVEH